MKKEFYNDNIEKLLKERSDEFKMLPSKRIWYSIYNDLHPSKKWPSISMGMFLVAIIGLLGYLNTSMTNTSLATNNTLDIKKLAVSLNTTNKTSSNIINIYNAIFTNKNQHTIPISTTYDGNNKIISAIKTSVVNTSLQQYPAKIKNIQTTQNDNDLENLQESNNSNKIITPLLSITDENKPALIKFTKTKPEEKSDFYSTDITIPAEKVKDIQQPQIVTKKTISKKANNLSNEDRSWIDNYAFLNKPKSNLFKERMLYEVYATPNLSFRKLSINSDYYGNNNLNNTTDINKSVTHYASFGVEAGVAMVYPLTKKMRLKSGLQFNYTNYAVSAFETNHPVVTTLMMNNLSADYTYLESRASTLANVSNPPSTRFHNKTYQLSVPIGAELKIASTQKFDWYVGATIQPTYVFAGNAYLISSDRKNYVHDRSLIRKFNINTAVETFVSYTTPNNIKLQFGPQYRYQLNSTYKKYSVSENLYQLGAKFGIIKML